MIVYLTLAYYEDTEYTSVAVFERIEDAECYAAALRRSTVLCPRLVEIEYRPVLDAVAAANLVAETGAEQASDIGP